MQNRYAAAGVALMLFATSGCEGNNTGAGAALGGIAGALVGDVAGRNLGRGGRLATTAAFGAGGALIGASIGSMLDARDRERAQASLNAALRRPLPPQYYEPAVYAPAPVYPAPAPAPTVSATPSRARPTARVERKPQAPAAVTPAPAAAPSPARTGNLPNLPIAPDRWVSDHSDAVVSTTILSATRPTDGRGECRTIEQAVLKANQRKSDTNTFCDAAPQADDWQKI